MKSLTKLFYLLRIKTTLSFIFASVFLTSPAYSVDSNKKSENKKITEKVEAVPITYVSRFDKTNIVVDKNEIILKFIKKMNRYENMKEFTLDMMRKMPQKDIREKVVKAISAIPAAKFGPKPRVDAVNGNFHFYIGSQLFIMEIRSIERNGEFFINGEKFIPQFHRSLFENALAMQFFVDDIVKSRKKSASILQLLNLIFPSAYAGGKYGAFGVLGSKKAWGGVGAVADGAFGAAGSAGTAVFGSVGFPLLIAGALIYNTVADLNQAKHLSQEQRLGAAQHLCTTKKEEGKFKPPMARGVSFGKGVGRPYTKAIERQYCGRSGGFWTYIGSWFSAKAWQRWWTGDENIATRNSNCKLAQSLNRCLNSVSIPNEGADGREEMLALLKTIEIGKDIRVESDMPFYQNRPGQPPAQSAPLQQMAQAAPPTPVSDQAFLSGAQFADVPTGRDCIIGQDGREYCAKLEQQPRQFGQPATVIKEAI